VYWLENTERDLSHYHLHMGTHPDSLTTDAEDLTQNSILVEGLTVGTTYWFGVTAIDEAGNESEISRLTDATPMNAAFETLLGWEDFQLEAYDEALLHFIAARSRDGTWAPAYLGEGWSLAFLDDLDLARVALLQANSLGLETQHANAGLAFVYRELQDWDSSMEKASSVLAHNAAWALPWRTSINWQDLRLTIAQCAYRLGESYFDDAQGQVDLLDPDNGLDPEISSSWVVGGITYDSYGVALLMLLVELEASIGG
jgi:tetratricopeptide (TPR) repeat protein